MHPAEFAMAATKLALLAALVSAAGCAPTVTIEWHTVASLPRAGAGRERPPSGIVTVDREVRVTVNRDSFLRPGGASRIEIHQVDEVVGAKPATWALAFTEYEKQPLRLLRVRTIAPDGTVREVDPGLVKNREVVEEDVAGRAGEEDRPSLFGYAVGVGVVAVGVELLAHGGEQLKDCDPVWRSSVRLTDLPPGTRVETVVVRDSDTIPTWFTESLVRTLPVERLRYTFDVDDAVTFDVRLLNHAAPVLRQSSGGRTRVTLDLRDLPGDPQERYSPTRLRRERWLVYHATSVRLGTRRVDLQTDWIHHLRNLLDLLQQYHQDNPDRRVPGISAGASASGNVRNAWLGLRAALRYDGEKPFRCIRNSSSVIIPSGRANSKEKPLLLGRALAQVGVSFGFALVSRDDLEPIDLENPVPDRFDHMLIRVVPQGDLAKPLWLDPSCERCALGEVPPEVVGREALLIHPTGMRGARFQITTVDAVSTGADHGRQMILARLDEANALEATEQWELAGGQAAELEVSTRSLAPAEWRQARLKELRSRHEGVELLQADPPRCDRALGKCEYAMTYRIPRYATAGDDGVRLPADLLARTIFEELARETIHGPRRSPIAPARPWMVEQTLVVRLPAGLTLDATPRTVTADAGVFVVTGGVSPGQRAVKVARSIEVRRVEVPAARHAETLEAARLFVGMRETTLLLRRDPSASAAPPALAP